MASDRVELKGSERPAVPDARRVGTPDPDTQAEITLTLRRRGDAPSGPVGRGEFAERYGADPEDIRRIEAFAAGHSLEVVDTSPARRPRSKVRVTT